MKLLPAFLLSVLMLSSPSQADQTDARLDDLFGQLTQTSDVSVANQLTSEIWTIWIETDSPDSQKIMQQGIDAMGQRDLKKALEIYDDLIVKEPDFAEAWNKRATVHYMLGNISQSAEDVKKTLELEPRHFGALSGLGLLYMATGKPKAALTAFEEALVVNPHLSGPKNNIKSLRLQIEKEKGEVL